MSGNAYAIMAAVIVFAIWTAAEVGLGIAALIVLIRRHDMRDTWPAYWPLVLWVANVVAMDLVITGMQITGNAGGVIRLYSYWTSVTYVQAMISIIALAWMHGRQKSKPNAD